MTLVRLHYEMGDIRGEAYVNPEYVVSVIDEGGNVWVKLKEGVTLRVPGISAKIVSDFLQRGIDLA